MSDPTHSATVGAVLGFGLVLSPLAARSMLSSQHFCYIRSMTGAAALARLKAGNAHFVAGYRSVASMQGHTALNMQQQSPFAIVLGCADSRAPAEHVFNVGLGELFVIRVAGNIIAPSLIGSVEFAAERYHSKLVVVMGHSSCGAVAATIESMVAGEDHTSPNVMAIVSRVRPALVDLVKPNQVLPELNSTAHNELHALATRANTLASVEQLRHGSAMIERLAAAGELLIIGATLDLQSGRVDFLD